MCIYKFAIEYNYKIEIRCVKNDLVIIEGLLYRRKYPSFPEKHSEFKYHFHVATYW
jgi:hypothetical protein